MRVSQLLSALYLFSSQFALCSLKPDLHSQPLACVQLQREDIWLGREKWVPDGQTKNKKKTKKKRGEWFEEKKTM